MTTKPQFPLDSSEAESPAISPQTEHVEELSQEECILRLEASSIGRVAAILDCRPYIRPVNYAVHEGAIVFRTRSGSHLHKATQDSYAALEIDSADFIYHEGWSVLVQGRSSHVTDPAEVIALARSCVMPWAGDDRDSFVRISLDEVRGERIGHRPPDAHERFPSKFPIETPLSENVQATFEELRRGGP